ncbi:MAG: hypothetical protein ABSF67_10775 [Roseiarcus sp.]|jgi:hypothetical protein
MRFRKWVALAATASIAFWTPSIIPVKASYTGCVVPTGYRTVDTAYATELPLPCPVSHTPSPWPAVTVIVGVVGVMVNAIYIWNTQCRELTSQEAVTSTFLPFIGMAFDAQASKCHR